MGLREKVTLTLVIIALIQIACRHCMPRTPRKGLKQYLNDLKPVKNNPIPTPYSPSRLNKTPKQTFGKTAQNGRNGQNALPNKSLYKTFNFPENEYPLDNSPRDPFSIGMNFNENNHVNTLQQAHNLQSSAISDLKKAMKMKRKLLSNKQVNIENRQLKTDMSSIKFAQSPESTTRLLDSETFPEVQYPLNTMDTWGPNYWNYLPFTQEKPFKKFGQQTFNPKAKEDINKPFTRLTKAKASKYLQSYDKLKEEHRRTSTENSKRSNVGQTGLNFTKTATCERVSDDFITAGLVSNIPSNSPEIKKELKSTKKTTTSENTCPVTEYPYHSMPIPYKVIEENTENICPENEPKNITKELQDLDNSAIAQTLQLIQEILFNDDTSSTVPPGNYSKEVEQNMNTSDTTVVSANEDVSTTVINSAESCTESPTEELSQEVSDDVPAGNLRNNMTSLPAELTIENSTTVASPLNVRMQPPSSEPITYEALTNALNSVPTPISNGNAVPGPTTIIIIPFNNNGVGKSQSHMFETSPDTPIIVYLPPSQSSDNPSQPLPFNQIVPSSLDSTVPNNQLYNILSNTAPFQNDSPYSNALVSELLNSNSDRGSSLPMFDTLPTNLMCYNNESSPSSMRENPVSDILIDKSLTDDAPFVTTTCENKLSEQPIETGDLDVNTDTLPPISDFEHPLFDFSSSEFTSLSHGPYNNVLNNELPIRAREIDSDQQILNVSSKDLFIPTHNVTSEHLHKTTFMNSLSEDSLSEIPNDILPVALDENFSSLSPTDSMEILKPITLLPDSIPNLQEHVNPVTESLPQTIDKILHSTPLIEALSTELVQPKESSLSDTLFSETLSNKLPITMDTKLHLTPVLGTTMESAPQLIGDYPMMTDMTLKTELHMIRRILDKMLSSKTPTYTQPPPIDIALLPNSESDSLLLPMNETPTERLPVLTEYNKMVLPLSATNSSQQLHEALPSMSVPNTLPGNKLVISNKLSETDTPSLPIAKTAVTSAYNKPYILDNLVTPLSETITSRTKATPNNDLLHKMDDLPLKMDLKFPDIYEVSSGDLPLPDDDSPTQVHPILENDLPTQVVETITSVSELPVLPKRVLMNDVLSLPVDEVLQGTSPDVPSVKTLTSGSIDKLLQDFPSTKGPSDGLPPLLMNVLKSSIRETSLDGKFNEILSKRPPLKEHLQLSVQKIIPDLALSDSLTNEPSLKHNSPSLVTDKDVEFPYSTVNTKDLPLVMENLLSPGNDATPDSLVTDIPSAVPLSTYLEEIQPTNVDKTSDKVLSQSTLSELPCDDVPLPEDNMLPLSNNTPDDLSLPKNKISSTSMLRITKVFLEDLLSDIRKGGLSSLVTNTPSVTPHSILDKTLYNIDAKSSFSGTKKIPLQPIENIFPNSENTDNPIGYIPLSVKLVDTAITDLPLEFLLPLHEMHKDKPYILTNDVKGHDKNEAPSLGNPPHDLPVLIDKVSPPKDTTKPTSSSKLPITKALLENVLSDITTKGCSVPVAQSLTVTSRSVLDKTLYNVESPISQITEDSPSRPLDKIFLNTLLTDHSTDYLPTSTEQSFTLPIDKTNSETQSLDIRTELTSPIDNILPDIPNISMYDKEQDESENPPYKNLTDDLSSASPMEGVLSLSKYTPSDLTLPKNKKPSSSKLHITKALLKNVLSDINTRGFSLPVAKARSVTPRSQLDKTLYFMESPIDDITEKTSVIPTDYFPSSGTNDGVSPQPTDKTLPDNTVLVNPTVLLVTDKIHNSDIRTDDANQEDKSEILTSDVEQEDKSDILTDDVEQKDKSDILTGEVEQEENSDILTSKVEQEGKSDILTDDVEQKDKSDILTGKVDKEDNSDILTGKVEQEDKSDILTDDVEQKAKSDILTGDEQQEDKSDILTGEVEQKANSDILTGDVEQEDKSDILTDDVEQKAKSDILTGDEQQEDKSDILTGEVEQKANSDILTGDVEQKAKSDILTGDVEQEDKSDILTDDVEQKAKSDILTGDEQQEDKSDILTGEVEQKANSDILTGDVEQEDKSDILTDDVEQKAKSDILTGDVEQEDKSDILTDDVEQKAKSDILTSDVEQEEKSDILTGDVEKEDKSDILTGEVEQKANSDILTGDVEQEDKSDILTDDVEQKAKSDILTGDVEQEDKSDILTDDVEQKAKSDILTGDVEQEDKSDILTGDVENEDKSDILIDEAEQEDKFEILTGDVEQEHNSDILTDDVEQKAKSGILTGDVEQEDKSDILTDDVEQEDKSDILTDDVEQKDKSDILTGEVEQEDNSGILTGKVEQEDKSDILTDDVEEEAKSDILTGEVEQADKSDILTGTLHQEDKSDILTGEVEQDKSDILTGEVEQEDKSDILTDDVEQNTKSDILTGDVEREDNSDILTGDVEKEDKSDILTDDVEQNAKSDILTGEVEQEDNSGILTGKVEQEDKSDILTDDVEEEAKSDILTGEVEQADKSEILTGTLQQEDKSDILTDDVEQNTKSDILTGDVERENNSDILTGDVEKEDKSDILTDDVEQNAKSDILTGDVEQEDKSDILTGDVQKEDKSDILIDNVQKEQKSDILIDDVEERGNADHLIEKVDDEDEDKSDICSDEKKDREKSDYLTEDIDDENDDQYDILSDDEEDRDHFNNLTDDIDVEDSNESLFSDDPTDDLPSDGPLTRIKPYLASRIPITKALLEKVLSDITDGGIHP